MSINPETLPENTAPSFEFQYVDIGSVGRGRLVEEPPTMAFGDAPSRARRVLRPGDTAVSTVRTYLRAVLPIDKPGLVGSTGFACLRPRRGLDARFLGWWAQSDGLIEEVVARSVGVSYPAINPSELGLIRFPVRPLAEQRAIADYLDTETARVDALISKKQRLAESLTERRIGMIDRLFKQQPVRPRLSRLLAQSPCYGVLKPDRYEGHDAVPCLRITDIKPSAHLDLTNAISISPMQHAEYRRTWLSKGDVLVSCVGTLGRASVVGEEAAGANVSRAVARLVPLPGLSPHYLCLWTESSEFRRAVDLVVNVTAQPVLNMGDLASMKVPVPEHFGETRRLTADTGVALAPIEQARTKLARQVTLLKEHRQALITAAVTGELEVPGVAA